MKQVKAKLTQNFGEVWEQKKALKENFDHWC